MYNSLLIIGRIYIRTYSRKIPKSNSVPNPGIQKRLNVIQETEIEDIDELESNFMSLGDVHREYENEILHYKEKQKYWTVKHKYFKERRINFLSWNDKEQIKHLHQSDPDYWTVEKLSESFPALPSTIQKILKGKWHKDTHKIEHHDKLVENNWKLLKSGQLPDLPKDLVEHLKKFSDREHKFVPKQPENTSLPAVNTKKNVKEFGSIIENYEKFKQIKEFSNHPNINHVAVEKLTGDSGDETKISNFKQNNEGNKIQLDSLQDLKKYKSQIISARKEKMSDVIKYPEKIKIPKDKYKKGLTYKVNDCYYDDDGEFLYRVPGMY